MIKYMRMNQNVDMFKQEPLSTKKRKGQCLALHAAAIINSMDWEK